MSSTSAKRKTSAVSADATLKKLRTDPAVDELEIVRIAKAADDDGVEEEDNIERASSLLDAWNNLSKWLLKMPDGDEVDLGRISTATLRAVKSRSHTFVDALHEYQSVTNRNADDLRTWLDKQLRRDDFVVSMLQAFRACQRSNPQTLAPFHDFIGELP